MAAVAGGRAASAERDTAVDLLLRLEVARAELDRLPPLVFTVLKTNVRGRVQPRVIRIGQHAVDNLRPTLAAALGLGGRVVGKAIGTTAAGGPSFTSVDESRYIVTKSLRYEALTHCSLEEADVLRICVEGDHDFVYQSPLAPVILRELQRRMLLSADITRLTAAVRGVDRSVMEAVAPPSLAAGAMGAPQMMPMSPLAATAAALAAADAGSSGGGGTPVAPTGGRRTDRAGSIIMLDPSLAPPGSPVPKTPSKKRASEAAAAAAVPASPLAPGAPAAGAADAGGDGSGVAGTSIVGKSPRLQPRELVVLEVQRLLYDPHTPEGKARTRFVSRDFPTVLAETLAALRDRAKAAYCNEVLLPSLSELNVESTRPLAAAAVARARADSGKGSEGRHGPGTRGGLHTPPGSTAGGGRGGALRRDSSASAGASSSGGKPRRRPSRSSFLFFTTAFGAGSDEDDEAHAAATGSDPLASPLRSSDEARSARSSTVGPYSGVAGVRRASSILDIFAWRRAAHPEHDRSVGPRGSVVPALTSPDGGIGSGGDSSALTAAGSTSDDAGGRAFRFGAPLAGMDDANDDSSPAAGSFPVAAVGGGVGGDDALRIAPQQQRTSYGTTASGGAATVGRSVGSFATTITTPGGVLLDDGGSSSATTATTAASSTSLYAATPLSPSGYELSHVSGQHDAPPLADVTPDRFSDSEADDDDDEAATTLSVASPGALAPPLLPPAALTPSSVASASGGAAGRGATDLPVVVVEAAAGAGVSAVPLGPLPSTPATPLARTPSAAPAPRIIPPPLHDDPAAAAAADAPRPVTPALTALREAIEVIVSYMIQKRQVDLNALRGAMPLKRNSIWDEAEMVSAVTVGAADDTSDAAGAAAAAAAALKARRASRYVSRSDSAGTIAESMVAAMDETVTVDRIIAKEVELSFYNVLSVRRGAWDCVSLLVDPRAAADVQTKCALLRAQPQSFFGIPAHLQDPDDWREAVDAMRAAESAIAPTEKLAALQNSARAVYLSHARREAAAFLQGRLLRAGSATAPTRRPMSHSHQWATCVLESVDSVVAVEGMAGATSAAPASPSPRTPPPPTGSRAAAGALSGDGPGSRISRALSISLGRLLQQDELAAGGAPASGGSRSGGGGDASASPSDGAADDRLSMHVQPLGADDFTPIFIYVTVQANLVQPLHLKEFLWLAADPQDLRGQGGYWLTVFEAAISFIRSCTIENVAPPLLAVSL